MPSNTEAHQTQKARINQTNPGRSGGSLYGPYVPCKKSDELKLKRPNDANHTSVAKDQGIIFGGDHLLRAHDSQNRLSEEENHILLEVLFERERQVDRLQL